MNTQTAYKQKITTKQKVDIIFNYLFDHQKTLEEDFFWNSLKDSELCDLKKITMEGTVDMDDFKKKVL